MNAKRGYIRGSDVTMRTMYSTRTRFQSPSPSLIYAIIMFDHDIVEFKFQRSKYNGSQCEQVE